MVITLLEFLQALPQGFHFWNRDDLGPYYFAVDASLEGWDPSDPSLKSELPLPNISTGPSWSFI